MSARPLGIATPIGSIDLNHTSGLLSSDVTQFV
jgi:hypothetical protein